MMFLRNDKMAAPMLKYFPSFFAKIPLKQRTVIGCVRTFCSKKDDVYDEDENQGFLPRLKPEVHPETPKIGMYEIDPPKGKIYDKKPFKISLTAGKKYYWCTCGHSKQQPFCDGTHKSHYVQMKRWRPDYAIRHNPIMFRVDEDKTVWLCNCKQTNKRPYCDGAHKQEDVQKAIRD